MLRINHQKNRFQDNPLMKHPQPERHVKRLREGLVFKAHRLLYHPTLVWRVMKKKRRLSEARELCLQIRPVHLCSVFRGLMRHEERGEGMHARRKDRRDRGSGERGEEKQERREGFVTRALLVPEVLDSKASTSRDSMRTVGSFIAPSRNAPPQS
jgi:hypothetical protein